MASMSAPLPPEPWYPGMSAARPMFIQIVPPASLPWHVRHPTLAAGAIAAALLFGALIAAHAEDAAPAKVPGMVSGSTTPAPVRAPPDFVPLVVDKAQYEAALDYLNGLPFKTALPLVKWLSELEDRAKRQWEADNAPKEEPKP